MISDIYQRVKQQRRRQRLSRNETVPTKQIFPREYTHPKDSSLELVQRHN